MTPSRPGRHGLDAAAVGRVGRVRAPARTRARLRLWGMPALLAALSGVGLVAALVGDGPWDAVGWATLGAPVVVTAWHALRPRRAPSGPEA
jgi:hypothetical protein